MAFPVTNNPGFCWGSEFASFQSIRSMLDPTVFGPAVVMAAITPDATGLVPLKNPLNLTTSPTRGLICDAAGTVVGHDAFGNAQTWYVIAGINWISVAGVTSLGTTAHVMGIW